MMIITFNPNECLEELARVWSQTLANSCHQTRLQIAEVVEVELSKMDCKLW